MFDTEKKHHGPVISDLLIQCVPIPPQIQPLPSSISGRAPSMQPAAMRLSGAFGYSSAVPTLATHPLFIGLLHLPRLSVVA
jgi:hypothetical protein